MLCLGVLHGDTSLHDRHRHVLGQVFISEDNFQHLYKCYIVAAIREHFVHRSRYSHNYESANPSSRKRPGDLFLV